MRSPVTPRDLHAALAAAFTRAELERLLEVQLEVRLRRIAGPDLPWYEVLYRVIQLAEEAGWQQELLDAAHAARPEDPVLASLALLSRPPAAADEEAAPPVSFGLARSGFESAEDPGPERAAWRRLSDELWRVCRVELAGIPEGTGVLVGPDRVLTAHQVIARVLDGRVKPSRVRARFPTEVGPHEARPDLLDVGLAADWLVDGRPAAPPGSDATDDALGHAVLRLERPVGLELRWPLGADSPRRGWVSFPDPAVDLAAGTQLVVAHYPGAGRLCLAAGGPGVLGANATRVRYSVAARYLSPGAPCFGPGGELVAVHLADLTPADRDAEEFEGVPVEAVRARIGRIGLADEAPAEAAAEDPAGGPPPCPPVLHPEDPQKGRWGGQPERSGRRVHVEVIDEARQTFFFNAIVSSTDGSPLQGPVVFHLHDTYFRSVIRVRKIREGKTAALEEVSSYGVYTLGVQVKDAQGHWVGLELDLADVEAIPRRFLGQ